MKNRFKYTWQDAIMPKHVRKHKHLREEKTYRSHIDAIKKGRLKPGDRYIMFVEDENHYYKLFVMVPDHPIKMGPTGRYTTEQLKAIETYYKLNGTHEIEYKTFEFEEILW